VLIARAEKAREVLPEELRKMGVPVEVVSIYRTARPRGDWERLNQLLAHGEIDMITFTSSSTVHNFLAALPSENPAELLRGVVIGCIGPITARTVQEYGLEAHVVPGIYTIDAFAQAIASVIPSWRYRAAQVSGQPVRQIVRVVKQVAITYGVAGVPGQRPGVSSFNC